MQIISGNVKVSEFFSQVSNQFGKGISEKAFSYFKQWSGEETRTVWSAFYAKAVLDEMVSYALADQ